MEAGMENDEHRLVEVAFIDGFRAASDRRGFLRLAAIPDELPDGLKLVEVRIEDRYTVGSAAPGFASSELVYHPLPAELIRGENELVFVYVSSAKKREFSLAEVLALRRFQPAEHSHADTPESGSHRHRHHRH
jgi:hypothetical protein